MIHRPQIRNGDFGTFKFFYGGHLQQHNHTLCQEQIIFADSLEEFVLVDKPFL